MDSKNLKQASLVLAVALVLMATGAAAYAQTGGGYDLTRWRVGSGGESVEGGGITLVGTVGQPDAGPALSGGGYTLVGGFWPGGGAVQYKVYLPLLVRNYR
jgi:hypothetical protein